MQTRILAVPDISCGHCERNIKNALHSIAGLTSVEVDIPHRQIKVELDESLLEFKTIGEVLEREGYPVNWDEAKPVKKKGGCCC